MLSKEELEDIRYDMDHYFVGKEFSRRKTSWPKDVQLLLDHIVELEAVLYDLRQDNTGYTRGWREGCEACFKEAIRLSGYPYKQMPQATKLVHAMGLIIAACKNLSEEPGNL